MKDKKTLRLVLNYVSRHKFAVIFLILFSLVSAIATLFIPIFVGDAIDAIIDVSQVDFNLVKKSVISVLLLALSVGASQWLTSVIGNRITFMVVRDIRRDAFSKIHKLPLSYLDTHRHGDTVSRIISYSDLIFTFIF